MRRQMFGGQATGDDAAEQGGFRGGRGGIVGRRDGAAPSRLFLLQRGRQVYQGDDGR